ncbi:hypothetical protein RRG08_018886 [Elysia crispata]|uniref:Uncharacterized protein n=1 Tax=Elysia crispata TaxID=231223 RepID=A0AAE1A884_9GAST|nr:hypothetical protein RRG08_018886 [Elysia crispata]
MAGEDIHITMLVGSVSCVLHLVGRGILTTTHGRGRYPYNYAGGLCVLCPAPGRGRETSLLLMTGEDIHMTMLVGSMSCVLHLGKESSLLLMAGEDIHMTMLVGSVSCVLHLGKESSLLLMAGEDIHITMLVGSVSCVLHLVGQGILTTTYDRGRYPYNYAGGLCVLCPAPGPGPGPGTPLCAIPAPRSSHGARISGFLNVRQDSSGCFSFRRLNPLPRSPPPPNPFHSS